MKKLFVVLVKLTVLSSLMLFTACASLRAAADRLGERYIGQSFDSFVMEHGAPVSEYKMKNGESLYIWNSGVISFSMPTTTTTYGQRMGSSFTANSYTSGGGSLDVFCELRFHTSSNGTIVGIDVTRDTIGMWNFNSRCAELF